MRRLILRQGIDFVFILLRIQAANPLTGLAAAFFSFQSKEKKAKEKRFGRAFSAANGGLILSK